jgi:CRISPR-associated protein Cmr2
MATYLLTLSLGPVQSLIETARRTRDLWCGSWLLSEAARAAALALHRAGSTLIFPYPEDPERDLQPQDEPQDDPKALANISNILRAQVEAAPEQVDALCAQARKAARDRLADLCARARDGVKRLPFHQDLWEDQRWDILESYAAWTPIEDGDYAGASKRLAGLLAARKATRDFLPAAVEPDGRPGYGIPKSSLDAARESVIDLDRKGREGPRYRTALRRLGLGTGEQLDALGVAKRRAGDPEQFTAYSRVAAEPWLQTLTEEQRQRLRTAYEPLVACELATRVCGNQEAYVALPYDGQLVYDFRLANALAAQDLTEEDESALRLLEKSLKAVCKETDGGGRPVGKPVPYAVVLKADGDRMGKLLSQAKQSADSQGISLALHGFASEVRGIVRDHRGHAIYSGGDDVLALVPLTSAVACADALRRAFAEAMAGSAGALGLPESEWPTLSVGLGIGHVMEPLGGLRARADAAERAAKGNELSDGEQRNALAIVLGIRSGADIPWRAQWNDETAFEALRGFIDAYRDTRIPSRVAYDLRAIGRYLAWLDDYERGSGADRELRAATAKGISASEVTRMLERACTDGGAGTVPEDLKDLILQRAATEPLDRLADTLIIARWLSARTEAELGERP